MAIQVANAGSFNAKPLPFCGNIFLSSATIYFAGNGNTKISCPFEEVLLSHDVYSLL
jgi:hypothetical protein